MRNQKAKKAFLLVLVLSLATSLATAAISVFADTAEMTVFESEYIKGQTLELKETTLGSVKAKPTLVAPSGKTYSGDSATLKEMGVYKAIFKEGNSVVKEETFRCVSPICSTVGNASVEYKANAATPLVYGLNAQLSDGSSFTYNKVLNLNNLTGKELVKLYVVPQNRGYCDFLQINFTLTDIYDSRNQVIVEVNNVTDGYHNGVWDYEYSKFTAYMRAGTILSTPSGIEYRVGEEVLHVGNTYGTNLICSFCGLGSGSYDKQNLSFSFDYEKKQILTKGEVVIDLDDPNHFTDIWNGFTTGEVLLSVSFSGYRSNYGTAVITEIGGEPVSSEATFYDEVSPEIAVDYGVYGSKDNIPSGCIQNAYSIFPATAKDTYSGNIGVATKVYFDYSGTKEEIALNNGAFVPTKKGLYTIEYTAVDRCGNLAKETVEVEIERSTAYIALSFAEDKITQTKAGKWIPVAEVNATGGYGEKTVSFEATAPDGSACEIKEGKILVIKKGNYTVKATATDYVGQSVSKTYTIAVTANDEPVFIDEVVTPRYFMNGYTYQLPTLQAYKADGNRLTPIATSIMVKDGGGNRTLTSDLFVPTVTADGSEVTVTYAATINGKTVSDKHTAKGYITKKTAGALLMDKFFVNTSKVTATANSASITLNTTAAGESSAFINALLANSFSLMANFGDMGGAWDTEFVLEDAENAKISVAASVRKTADGYYFIVDGKENLLRTFDETADYYLVFSNVYSRIGLKNATSGTTAWFSLSGDGVYFPSGKVYLTVNFKSISASSATLTLKSLNRQNLKSMGADLLAPSIDLFADAVGKKYVVGDSVLVSKAVALDVLDPYVTLSVTVKDSDKNFVKDKATGLTLNNVSAEVDYSFNVEAAKTYLVVYTATYDDGEKETYQFAVTVADTKKPTFRLEHKVATTASVGRYVYVPKAIATDDKDGATDVYYYVITPDGVVRTFERDKYDGFKVQTKGTYTIRYVSYDASGNMALYDYKVVVG